MDLVLVAGLNDCGQLGLGNSIQRVSRFTKVPLESQSAIKSITCGWDYTIILTESDEFLVSGSNKNGALLLQENICYQYHFVKVSHGITECISKIICAPFHSLALTAKYSVFGWGNAKKNRIGFSGDIQRSPVRLNFPEPKIIDIAIGVRHTVALGATGTIYVNIETGTGFVSIFQLDQINRLLNPVLFSTWNSFFIHTTDKFFGWGKNNFGQIEFTGPEIINSPVILHFPFSVQRIRKIAAGSEHMLILTEKGDVWSWGWNEHGNCGTTPAQKADKQLIVTGIAKNIFCGYAHCFVELKE